MLRGVFVGCRERGEGAGEVGKVILYDAFDGGGERRAGFAEQTAQIGRRDGCECGSEFGGAGLANGLAGGWR
jgi:hypothetical protein